MSKVITIDARWLVGGIGTYTRNLVQSIHRHCSAFSLHAIVRERDSTEVSKHCAGITVIDTPIYTVREQWQIARASRHTDLLHVPHYNAPLLCRGPLVVHLRLPGNRRLSTYGYAWPMLLAVSRRADQIVTVSQFSKREIVDALGVPESKITVIPCGVSNEFSPSTARARLAELNDSFHLPSPFILYVGNLKPHKNVITLLRAFALLRKTKRIPHALVIVGDDPHWRKTTLEACRRLGISDLVRFLPHVEQCLLPGLYGAAEAVVLPSTLEGFGLPVIEAMACGTPVIASNAASLPEVGGDSALYFDPVSAEELAGQVERLLASPELRSRLQQRGLQRAQKFSWQECAREHIALYSGLLGHTVGAV